jgi:hypothetical protein
VLIWNTNTMAAAADDDDDDDIESAIEKWYSYNVNLA